MYRNIVTYLFSVMSKNNNMPYREKKKAEALINDENVRNVVRKKHKTPYFESHKVKMAIAIIYFLLRETRMSWYLQYCRNCKLVFKMGEWNRTERQNSYEHNCIIKHPLG